MRKNGVRLVALACAAMAASTANAQTRGGFEAGAEVFDYSYRERLEGQTIVRDDGLFKGVALGYVETIGRGAFLRARMNFGYGSVDYRSDGSIIGEPADARLDNVPQSIGQLELHVGKDFQLKGGTTITPFIGLGSRYLLDESGGEKTEDGLFGYDREVSYGYVPLGVATKFRLGSASSLTLSAQYNWVVHGDVKAKFSDVDPELPDVELELDKGHGFELSAMASIPAGRNAINVGPFFRRWKIGQSKSFILKDPEGSGESIEFFEPKNHTCELGLRVTFSF
jgi:hypothetical protein